MKSQPKKLSYAEGAVGSVTHLAMALFLKRAGLEMTNVSYRGNAPALTDIVAGQSRRMFSNVSDALPQIKSGAIRPLAVSSAAPVPQLPGVPTVAASFPGYMAITWNGLMAPAGTPKPIIDKMAAEIARACKDPKFIERLASLGADPLGNTPQEFAALIAADLKTWGEAVAVAGVKTNSVEAQPSVTMALPSSDPSSLPAADRSASSPRWRSPGRACRFRCSRPRAKVNDMPRAATTHAATLEMLADLGMVDEVIERGLVEPLFRIWDRPSQADRGRIRLRHAQGRDPLPVRRAMRAAQARRHGARTAAAFPHAKVEFSTRVTAVDQFGDGVEIEVEGADGTRKIAGVYLIGADGGRSTVRKAIGIEFEGYTHPERFHDPDHDRSTSAPCIRAARATTSPTRTTGSRCSR